MLFAASASCYLQLGLVVLPESLECVDLSEKLSLRPLRGDDLMLLSGDEDDGVRRSEGLEEATLREPVRVKAEEVEVFGEDLGEESEAAWGNCEAAGGARVVLVRLKEEEAVLRAKPGSGEEVEVLCRGVAGALRLPPP